MSISGLIKKSGEGDRERRGVYIYQNMACITIMMERPLLPCQTGQEVWNAHTLQGIVWKITKSPKLFSPCKEPITRHCMNSIRKLTILLLFSLFFRNMNVVLKICLITSNTFWLKSGILWFFLGGLISDVIVFSLWPFLMLLCYKYVIIYFQMPIWFVCNYELFKSSTMNAF